MVIKFKWVPCFTVWVKPTLVRFETHVTHRRGAAIEPFTNRTRT